MECGIWYSEQEKLPRIFEGSSMKINFDFVKDNENIELLQFQLFDILVECEPRGFAGNIHTFVKVRVYAKIEGCHIEGMDPQNGGSDCVESEIYEQRLANHLIESEKGDIIKKIRNRLILLGSSSNNDIEISPLDIVAEPLF